jgi:hypothetical protein
MPTLPAHLNLDQLPHQAKDLLRAAKTGDADARGEIKRVADRVTLDAAQLAVARRYGCASWAKLKTEVEARNVELAEQAIAFCQASVNESVSPSGCSPPAQSSPRTASQPRSCSATRPGSQTICAAIRAARPAPTRAGAGRRFTSPARLAGASSAPPAPTDSWLSPGSCLTPASTRPRRPPAHRRTGRLCAASSRAPTAGEQPPARRAASRTRCCPERSRPLPRRLRPRLRSTAAALARPCAQPARDGRAGVCGADRQQRHRHSTAAPGSGCDPSRYRDDDGQPVPIVWAAVRADSTIELLELLLANQANPNSAGPDGHKPYRLAAAAGKTDVCDCSAAAASTTGSPPSVRLSRPASTPTMKKPSGNSLTIPTCSTPSANSSTPRSFAPPRPATATPSH